jgi:glycosyltransferase involved in cell wall biosynthesis
VGDGLRARFGIALDAPIVLFLGRKEEGKGIRHVVDAMQRLWQEGSLAVLVLAGAATEYSRRTLDPYLSSLPAAWRSKIVSRDNIDEGEKWGWYEECDLLAHPSRVESFGLVFLEAWRSGKPIIGCRSGPMISLIDHGIDGLLVGYGNVGELALAIGTLLANPDTAEALGQAGRAKALAQFTWSHVIDRAHAIYRVIVERYHETASRQRHRRHIQ